MNINLSIIIKNEKNNNYLEIIIMSKEINIKVKKI